MAKLTFFQIIKSIGAALIGVQKSENLQRDIEQGSIWVYIVAGIIGTLALIFVLAWIVSQVTG